MDGVPDGIDILERRSGVTIESHGGAVEIKVALVSAVPENAVLTSLTFKSKGVKQIMYYYTDLNGVLMVGCAVTFFANGL